MKACLNLLLGGLLLLASSGCSPLGSVKPLGANPVVLKPEEINGSWAANGGHVRLLVTDATNGTALASWIEESGNDFKLEKAKLVIRRTGETIFVNVHPSNQGNENYLVGRGKVSDETLIFWPADKDAVKRAVKAGKLVVTDSDSNELVVTTNFQQAAEFLASPEGKAIFELDEPTVLTRMPR